MLDLSLILNHLLLLIKGFQVNNNRSDKLSKAFRNHQIKVNNLMNSSSTVVNHITNNLFLIDLRIMIIIIIKMFIVLNNMIINQTLVTNLVLHNRYYL